MKKTAIILLLICGFAASCASERNSLEIKDTIIGYTPDGCEVHYIQSRSGMEDTYIKCNK